jgi:hypothetical protein
MPIVRVQCSSDEDIPVFLSDTRISRCDKLKLCKLLCEESSEQSFDLDNPVDDTVVSRVEKPSRKTSESTSKNYYNKKKIEILSDKNTYLTRQKINKSNGSKHVKEQYIQNGKRIKFKQFDNSTSEYRPFENEGFIKKGVGQNAIQSFYPNDGFKKRNYYGEI